MFDSVEHRRAHGTGHCSIVKECMDPYYFAGCGSQFDCVYEWDGFPCSVGSELLIVQSDRVQVNDMRSIV